MEIYTNHIVSFPPLIAITGAAVLYAVTPSKRRGNLGVLELRDSTTMWQGFAVESILGFLVTFVFLSGTDPNKEDSSFGPRLAYGSITVGAHLFGVRYFAICKYPFSVNYCLKDTKICLEQPRG